MAGLSKAPARLARITQSGMLNHKALTGTRTTMLVPRPGAVRTVNTPFSLFTLARMLTNPNPSLISAVAIPHPSSFTLRVTFGGSKHNVTLIVVDFA